MHANIQQNQVSAPKHKPNTDAIRGGEGHICPRGIVPGRRPCPSTAPVPRAAPVRRVGVRAAPVHAMSTQRQASDGIEGQMVRFDLGPKDWLPYVCTM